MHEGLLVDCRVESLICVLNFRPVAVLTAEGVEVPASFQLYEVYPSGGLRRCGSTQGHVTCWYLIPLPLSNFLLNNVYAFMY